MSFVGMEIDQVRQLARQLTEKAHEIDHIASQLTGQLGQTHWEGTDATRFRGEWDSHHHRALRTVSQALQQAADAANRNAGEQESASH